MTWTQTRNMSAAATVCREPFLANLGAATPSIGIGGVWRRDHLSLVGMTGGEGRPQRHVAGLDPPPLPSRRPSRPPQPSCQEQELRGVDWSKIDHARSENNRKEPIIYKQSSAIRQVQMHAQDGNYIGESTTALVESL